MQKLIDEISKVIIGQEKLIKSIVIGLLTNSHILIEGLPGVAKTTAVKSVAKAIGLDFKRIQFTPDLIPSDILGVEIYNQKTSEFQIIKGPIFANLVLADEINRSPAKVQSALLEAMQERQITISNKTFALPNPFMVLATQNPIEEEGTYTLPQAEMDRFLLKTIVHYPSKEQEFLILKNIQTTKTINQVLTKEELLHYQEKVKNLHIDDELLKYIVNIVAATRAKNEYIEFGASPRASISILYAAKANAFLKDKDYVTPLDIIEIIPDVLRHRIVLSYKAYTQNIKIDTIIDKIIQSQEVP